MKCAVGKNCFHVLRKRALGWWEVSELLLRGLSQARAEGPRSKLAMKDSIGSEFVKSESASSVRSFRDLF